MTAETRPTAVAPLDRPNLQKRTPLHTSAERGNTDLVRLYMKKGADILAQDENGWISLHLAVRNGHRPTVEALLDKEYPTLQMLQVSSKSPLSESLLYRRRGLMSMSRVERQCKRRRRNNSWALEHKITRDRQRCIWQ